MRREEKRSSKRRRTARRSSRITSEKYSNPPPPVGQASNGPTGLVSHTGTSWHLPNCAVEYPLSFSVRASGEIVLGSTELYPGAPVAISVMPPMPAEWWLRPVNRAWRLGEQRAVVWKRLYFRPPAASFSALGVTQGPPKALADPNPASSIRMMRTLGAPFGGRSCSIGGNLLSGSFAS